MLILALLQGLSAKLFKIITQSADWTDINDTHRL